jgi:hypothetical protein
MTSPARLTQSDVQRLNQALLVVLRRRHPGYAWSTTHGVRDPTTTHKRDRRYPSAIQEVIWRGS